MITVVQAGGNNFTFESNYDSAGVYYIGVTIGDGEYNISYSWDLTIINKNRKPTAIISSPLDNAEFTINSNIFFDASGSSDPDNDDLTYSWTSSIDGNIGNAATFGRKLSRGTHIITLTVNDGQGGTDTAQITITVKKPSEPTGFIPGFEAHAVLLLIWILAATITVFRKRKKV